VPIEELIDTPDTFEIVRDQIASILLLESASQQGLAVAAGKDPSAWELRVFLERSTPWAEFLEEPAGHPPIVNVSYDSGSFDGSQGSVVDRQASQALYHVDVYGVGVAREEDVGHEPGDRAAALEAHRAMRLVRRILMAGHYTYLGLRGTVWRRWLRSTQVFQPAIDGRTVQHVVGARMTFEVTFNEFAPQVQGAALEELHVQVHRAETGELLLSAQYQGDDDGS
jgi:hypothetical protein